MIENHKKEPADGLFVPSDAATNERIARRAAAALTVILAVNQFFIGSLMPKAASASHQSKLLSLFGVKTASALVIIGPTLNPDGKTTSLTEMPTISEVAASPKTGDDVADAKAVMLATGQPLYAPDDISFDDPVKAEAKWAAYEQSIQLTGALQTRYDNLVTVFPCNYCCGEPMAVTRNRQCGCAHAKAARGYFKYMLQTYGDKYSDAQLMGEAFRWQAIWYPKGAVSDYMLAIGKSSVLPHQPHGGAGADGMHGLAK